MQTSEHGGPAGVGGARLRGDRGHQVVHHGRQFLNLASVTRGPEVVVLAEDRDADGLFTEWLHVKLTVRRKGVHLAQNFFYALTNLLAVDLHPADGVV